MNYEFTVSFTPEELSKPYSGPDVNQKFPGEDDLLWCERCNTHHRRGAPWEVERERAIQKVANKIAEKIDSDAILLLGQTSR